jgi:hypothetical protein
MQVDPCKLLNYVRELPADKKAILITEYGMNLQDLENFGYVLVLILAWYIEQENPCYQLGDVIEALFTEQDLRLGEVEK